MSAKLKVKVFSAIALLLGVCILAVPVKGTYDWLIVEPSCDACWAHMFWQQCGLFVLAIWGVVLWVGAVIFGRRKPK